MITREKFKDLVYKMLGINEFYDKLYELGIDILGCKCMDAAGIFFDELMTHEFGEDGMDLISWWMYEDVDHVLYEDESDGKPVADLNNIDDLYTYLAERGRDIVIPED